MTRDCSCGHINPLMSNGAILWIHDKGLWNININSQCKASTYYPTFSLFHILSTINLYITFHISFFYPFCLICSSQHDSTWTFSPICLISLFFKLLFSNSDNSPVFLRKVTPKRQKSRHPGTLLVQLWQSVCSDESCSSPLGMNCFHPAKRICQNAK